MSLVKHGRGFRIIIYRLSQFRKGVVEGSTCLHTTRPITYYYVSGKSIFNEQQESYTYLT